MFAAAALPPPSTAPAIAVIDEQWAAASRAAPGTLPARPPAAPAQVAMVDPRIAQGVAAVLAEAPARDTAPNRQEGLQAAVYGSAAQAKFARDFSDAKVPACLSPSSGGLGLFAIPVIAVQALRGKCLMP